MIGGAMKGSFQRFRIFTLFVLAFSFVLLSAWNVKAQYTIFSGQVPASSGTDDNYELGTKFTSSHLAEVTAIRFYKMAGETGAHTGKIWSNSGQRLAEVTFSSESSSGWQTAALSSPLRIEPGTKYVVSVNANTEYPITQNGFITAVSNGFLTGEMGVFNVTREEYPADTYNSSSYFVDITASPLDQVFTTQVPTADPFTGEGDLELGLKFTTSTAAKVKYIRYYKVAGETGEHTGNLWAMNGSKLASVSFTGETNAGWQYARLNDEVYLEAGTTYVVSVNSNVAYGAMPHALESPVTNGVLTAPSGNNGIYNETPGVFPSTFFDSPNYFRDIVVVPLYTPQAPVNPSPTNEMTGVSIEPVLSWQAVAGVTSYTLQLAEDAGFTANLRTFTSITSNSFAIAGLSNGKSYYWRVKGVNDIVEGNWSSTFKFTTIAHTDVVLSYPKGGVRLFNDKPQFTWYVPAGGTGWKYDLIYSTDQNFASYVTIGNLTQNQYTLEGLQAGRTYYWKIRLKTAAGAVVGYSAKESFISFGEALKPVASWPVGNATVYSLSQDLYWYLNGASTGLTYALEMREGAPTALTNNATNTGINDTHYKVTGLLSGKQYSWHVKSISASGESSWSDPVSFKTAAAEKVVVPVASWPIGYPVVYTLTPSLNWYLGAASDGLTFDVEIVEGLQTSFTNSPTFYGIASLSVVTNPLMPGKDYKWQVRSFDGVNYSGWSKPATFKVAGTIGNAPVVPNPSWPVKGALVYSTETTLSWYTGTVSTGLKYDVEYGQGALTGAPTKSDISDLSVEITGLEAGKPYNWRVRSTSPLGISGWSKTETFKTASNAPIAKSPVLSWPVKGVTVYTNSPVLSWFLNSPSEGLTYELKYSTSSSMTGAVIFDGITETKYELKNLTPGATYYWQVRSYDGTVYSSPSATGSFVVFAGNAAVVPLAGSPVEGVQTGSLSPVLSWFIPASGDVESYIVEYSKKSDMSEPVSIEVQNNSVALDKLSAESSYYWRVRSLNSKGEKSAFSETASFSTSSATGVEKKEGAVPSEFALGQNFPNPFNPATIIEFSLARDGFYSLEVYNILGEKVQSIMQGNMKAGSYKVNFNAKDLMSGIYFYRLTGSGLMMVKKMMLVK
jgi:hypothetical protein